MSTPALFMRSNRSSTDRRFEPAIDRSTGERPRRRRFVAATRRSGRYHAPMPLRLSFNRVLLATGLGALFVAGAALVLAVNRGTWFDGEEARTAALAPVPRAHAATRVEVELSAPPPASRAAAGPTFERDARPILIARCAGCHGEEKQKGGLRLDRADFVDTHAGVVVAGRPQDSELVRRVLLPEDDDERMPPKGERLSRSEIETLQRWIAAGAARGELAPIPEREAVTDASPPDDLLGYVASAAETAAARAMHLAGGRAEPVSEGSARLEVNLSFVRRGEWPAALDALATLAPRVVELNLARTLVQDDDLDVVARCRRLANLHLEATAVTHRGLYHLLRLAQLEYLNLHSSAVGDDALAPIAEMKALRRVYLWGTLVSPDGVERLRSSRPDLIVDVGADGAASGR
jgi:mono/diheme cytochrome c family protein